MEKAYPNDESIGNSQMAVLPRIVIYITDLRKGQLFIQSFPGPPQQGSLKPARGGKTRTRGSGSLRIVYPARDLIRDDPVKGENRPSRQKSNQGGIAAPFDQDYRNRKQMMGPQGETSHQGTDQNPLTDSRPSQVPNRSG
jgi:hypothetical protein